ncbi:MAG: hypothetical protein QNJ84_11940 [Alphaproteobacteria bacterium]|nr:hypothetical protein [Alphaproteobacteria bacterium]
MMAGQADASFEAGTPGLVIPRSAFVQTASALVLAAICAGAGMLVSMNRELGALHTGASMTAEQHMGMMESLRQLGENEKQAAQLLAVLTLRVENLEERLHELETIVPAGGEIEEFDGDYGDSGGPGDIEFPDAPEPFPR